MAIDSREKRQSVVAISFYFYGPSVFTNASQDQEWSQQAGYGYSGILAGAPVAPIVDRDGGLFASRGVSGSGGKRGVGGRRRSTDVSGGGGNR